MISSTIKDKNENAVEMAVELLRNGEIIAFPTETVYGLGCDINNRKAIQKIYELKLRPGNKPLSAMINMPEDISQLCDNVPRQYFELAKKWLPGPLAIILNAKKEYARAMQSPGDTIAARCPDYSFIRQVIRRLGSPLATTSANISGQSSITNASMLSPALARELALIVDGGQTKYACESTIIDICSGEIRLIRSGAIEFGQIKAYKNM